MINICNYLIENKELPLLVENILKNKPQKILIDSNLNDLDSKGIFNIAKKLENAHLTIQGPPGTGKSTIMGEVIYKLFKEGKKLELQLLVISLL